MAYYYALVPNSYEWNMNITNSQWHLALAAFMLIVSVPAIERISLLDAGVLGLSGLSGPFSILFIPFALREYVSRRTQRSLLHAGIVTLTSLIQLLFVVVTVSARPHVQIGAAIMALCKIVTYQILLAGLIGSRLTGVLLTSAFWRSDTLATVAVVFAAALVVAALLSGPAIYRKFLGFIALLLAAALVTPNIQTKTTAWNEMLHLGSDDRYFVAPILIWFATILILYASRRAGLRVISGVLMGLAVFGMCFDAAYPPYVPTNFTALAAVFAAARPGDVMVFPENPPGWSMVLRKHRSD